MKSILARTHCVQQDLTEKILFSNDKEYLAKVKYLPNGSIVGISNLNLIWYGNPTEKKWNNINAFYKSTLLETYSNFIATAGFKYIGIYEFNPILGSISIVHHQSIMTSIIRSFKFLSQNEFLICDESGICMLCEWDKTQIKIISEFQIPTKKERWITAALRYDKFLVVGDRSGHLHLFENVADGQVTLCHTLKHVHGNLGCTSLIYSKNCFISAGHDGTIKEIDIHCDTMPPELRIRLTHKTPITWIDKIESNLVAGFNENHFMIWNMEKLDTVEKIECGGGHRYWDLYINGDQCEFVYIRNKRIFRTTLAWSNIIMFKNLPISNWHTKSCNIVKCLATTSGDLLISGGDDNCLKFSRIKKNGYLEHINDMILHISSVKTVYTVELTKKKWLIFSAGGRAQICLTAVELLDDDRIHLSECTQFMLNLSDQERRRQGTSNVIDFDPETRFMSLIVFNNTEDIVCGCSDGLIRHFKFDGNRRIEFVSAVQYGKCILNVHYFYCGREIILLTMATDGKICFWSWSQFSKDTQVKPFFVLHHHDSGIQAFDLMKSNEGHFYLATGGDDQSVVLTIFNIDEQQLKVHIKQTHDFKHSHTAQVNGVRFCPRSFCLYSTGVDQTVFHLNLNTFVSNKFCESCVADIKGINVMEKELLVYGYGVQLLKVNK